MITQVDIGSSQQVNNPQYLIGAHQTRARADMLKKFLILLNMIISIFKNIILN